jgi:hypothetical protein
VLKAARLPCKQEVGVRVSISPSKKIHERRWSSPVKDTALPSRRHRFESDTAFQTFSCGCSSNGTKSAALPTLRLRVQVPSSTSTFFKGSSNSVRPECLSYKQEVESSNLSSTIKRKSLWRSLTGRAPDCYSGSSRFDSERHSQLI